MGWNDTTVHHERFGVGTILEITDSLVSVNFHNPVQVKKFVYPDAFEQFLRADCEELSKAARELIEAKRERIEWEGVKKAQQLVLDEENKKRESLVVRKKSKPLSSKPKAAKQVAK